MIIISLQTAISLPKILFNIFILDYILLSYNQYMSFQNLIDIFFDAFCD